MWTYDFYSLHTRWTTNHTHFPALPRSPTRTAGTWRKSSPSTMPSKKSDSNVYFGVFLFSVRKCMCCCIRCDGKLRKALE